MLYVGVDDVIKRDTAVEVIFTITRETFLTQIT